MPDVLIDSSAWIDFLRSGSSEEVSSLVDRLLVEDRAVLCGVVEMELLQGVRPHERKNLENLLRALPYIETERRDFIAAAHRMTELRSAGITIPNSDCLIGVLCVRHELLLLTLDAHFDHLAEVSRFNPDPPFPPGPM